MTPSENAPCPCGSGNHVQLCCGREGQAAAPPPPDHELDQIVDLYRAGAGAELATRVRHLLENYPHAAEARRFLGERLRASWPSNKSPDDAKAHCNLGGLLQSLGQTHDAVNCYRQAIAIEPALALAHYNLGTALQASGELKAAADAYRNATLLMPSLAEAHINLGNTLQGLGELSAAATSLQKAIAIAPARAESHYNLGNVFAEAGMNHDAITSYLRALELNVEYGDAHCALGNALCEVGRYVEAISSYRKAIAIEPGRADMHNNLGRVLLQCDRFEEALASYNHALALDPGHAESHNNLGVLLLDRRDHHGAMSCFHRALALQPDFAEAEVNLGNTLKDLGQLDSAKAALERALAINPGDAAARSNLLFLTAYHSMLTPPRYLELARDWERHCVPADLPASSRQKFFSRPLATGRRLRVGYVSGDFLRHPVSYFIEQLFACHDRTRIELFVYSTNPRRDDVTARIETLVDHWIPVAGINDDTMLAQLDTHGIDVLVDLSGHTAHNRMGVFARRAAPVQVHYLGYFASTGLTCMDYLIGDEYLTPATTDDHFTETIWRLPRVRGSYDGKSDAPDAHWSPHPNGNICLGSFNNLGKLTAATFRLWAQVLHALPNATLLLKTKALNDPGVARRVADAMAGFGIAAPRLLLTGSAVTPTWHDHMNYYNRLDIALDPVGAHGGYTTTCDALWMGVPVITLAGDRMASRMTGSILHAVGHPEWIAGDEQDYVDKVVALARDADLRGALRPGQRARIAASSLCNAKNLAASLEDAYGEMFRRWQLQSGAPR